MVSELIRREESSLSIWIANREKRQLADLNCTLQTGNLTIIGYLNPCYLVLDF